MGLGHDFSGVAGEASKANILSPLSHYLEGCGYGKQLSSRSHARAFQAFGLGLGSASRFVNFRLESTVGRIRAWLNENQRKENDPCQKES